MSVGLHCDAPGCDTWSTNDKDFDEWVIVTLGPHLTVYFCCGWCMTKWAAERFEPTEVVE